MPWWAWAAGALTVAVFAVTGALIGDWIGRRG